MLHLAFQSVDAQLHTEGGGGGVNMYTLTYITTLSTGIGAIQSVCNNVQVDFERHVRADGNMCSTYTHAITGLMSTVVEHSLGIAPHPSLPLVS